MSRLKMALVSLFSEAHSATAKPALRLSGGSREVSLVRAAGTLKSLWTAWPTTTLPMSSRRICQGGERRHREVREGERDDTGRPLQENEPLTSLRASAYGVALTRSQRRMPLQRDTRLQRPSWLMLPFGPVPTISQSRARYLEGIPAADDWAAAGLWLHDGEGCRAAEAAAGGLGPDEGEGCWAAAPAGSVGPDEGEGCRAAVPAGSVGPDEGGDRWAAAPAGGVGPDEGEGRWAAAPAGGVGPDEGGGRWAAPAGRRVNVEAAEDHGPAARCGGGKPTPCIKSPFRRSGSWRWRSGGGAPGKPRYCHGWTRC
ncbi:hypothetical protein EYF80_051455 [Liparis tanakae]|uniref:Uncharacterized protein n=1 Tax=Liparis tanakae TaxID=230148 RepID=A0A4Z2FBX8_9TELE|nr:hypothetical protein EYF80_051455 [Liparis tanakae]